MDTRVRDEVAKQVRHAIHRPCKRVYIGTYNHEDGEYQVYVSVEKKNGKNGKGKGRKR